MTKSNSIFKMTKKKAAGCIAALSLLMVPCTALAASSTQNYVYDGVTVTVSATCYATRGIGYGRYVDTSKSLGLTVTFRYQDYDGNWNDVSGRAGGTTYVSASSPNVGSTVEASRKTISTLTVGGVPFETSAKYN